MVSLVRSETLASLYQESLLELDAQTELSIQNACVSGYRLAQTISESSTVYNIVTSSSFVDCVDKFKLLLQNRRAELQTKTKMLEEASVLISGMHEKLAGFKKDLETLRPELDAVNGEVSMVEARIALEEKEVR